MPVLNESRHLADSVAMVLDQDWPGELELVLALGPSSDATDEIAARLSAADPRVRTVPNPSGRTPEGLNAAIAASTGEIVARVDAHAEIPRDYLRDAVAVLEETGADNVGGIMDAVGVSALERAIACAMKSPLGVGGSRFHVGGTAGESDTVYLGVFRREALERVGGYDPHFARAQDWEMNHRIRTTGGRVWFTPDLVVTYRPRSSLSTLADQYFNYGRWRRVVARLHPGTANSRYLAPPTMVVGTVAATLVGLAWRPAWLVPVGYAAGVTLGGWAISKGEDPAVRVRVPVAIATMHWSWGLGFITSPSHLSAGLSTTD
ncbi:glycosyltransferase family 2 protein [Janibacter limosus]|jgi:glycosyltransferase involved in cell wall biosynthesis|uniref:Glycosyltransferase family 2 protein n=1 Tax=Janibacter limosus TaxID=53458 RepID=A0A4P6N035_9MICO|nr:glycosyltransferase family 2 protein [Janibacter limosus]QBF47855.1 glycosyltransferase family 2 protein [Janibacter limosus]